MGYRYNATCLLYKHSISMNGAAIPSSTTERAGLRGESGKRSAVDIDIGGKEGERPENGESAPPVHPHQLSGTPAERELVARSGNGIGLMI